MDKKDFEVYCIKYAESLLSESMVFDGGSKEKLLPISFAVYLVKTDNKRILIDAGCNTMPGFEMQKFYSPAFVLRTVGVTVDEVTDVIITHAHHDHIEALHHFKNAVVHISKREYSRKKRYIPDDMAVNLFEDESVIYPNIKVIEWRGHSKGSALVEIETDTAVHVFAGDECYTDMNTEQKICTGSYFDKEKAMQFVEKYSAEKYRVHTCHDSKLKTERIL